MPLLLLALAHASDSGSTFIAGGGAELGAGAYLPPGGSIQGEVAAPQLEGDIGLSGGPVSFRLDVDLGMWFGGASPQALTLTPEQAWVKVGGKGAWLAAGDFTSPWRRESVDPWDRALTSASMLARHGVPSNVAGALLGAGSTTGGISGFAGVDLGLGVNLLQPTSSWAPGTPFLVGGRGHLGNEIVDVGLGGLYRPGPGTGALEVDARVDAYAVVVEGEAVLGLLSPSGATVSVELMPHFIVEPTARLEWWDGAPGGALGVAIRPAPFLRFAAEAAYADGTPAVWVSADIYNPATSRRSGDGGSPG